MGTRSTVKFCKRYAGNELENIASIYRQYDGYPDGAGYDLAVFLNERELTNGYTGEMTSEKYANGIGCLAAQYIAYIKDSIGNVYMTNPLDSQEFNYIVVHQTTKDGAETIAVSLDSNGEEMFTGSKEGFLDFCKSYE